MNHNDCVEEKITCMKDPVNRKSVIINHTIEKIKKIKEIIYFALAMEKSLKMGKIGPDCIFSKIEVGGFIAERDWVQYSDVLKDDFSNILNISVISYAIIICKESYTSLFVKRGEDDLLFAFADKIENPDLYAAQNIFRIVRNALGHMKAVGLNLDALAYWDFRTEKDKNLGMLAINSIGVSLDTTNLHEKQFNWNDLGGIGNFLKVLDFLESDLQEKLNNLK